MNRQKGRDEHLCITEMFCVNTRWYIASLKAMILLTVFHLWYFYFAIYILSTESVFLNWQEKHFYTWLYRSWGLHRGTCTPGGIFCHYVGSVGGCPLTTKWGMPRPESVVLLRYRGSKFDLPKNYTRKPRNGYASSKSCKLFESFVYHYFCT